MKKLILYALLILTPCTAWGADYYINTGSTGGNGTTTALSGTNAAYATLSAAVAARCPISENTTFHCAGSTDTAAVAITTVGAYTLTIQGDWVGTQWDYAKYHIYTENQTSLNISTNNVIITNMQVCNNYDYAKKCIGIGPASGAGCVVVKNSYIKGINSGLMGIGGNATGRHLVYNCIIERTGPNYNIDGISWYVEGFNVNATIANCTIYNCTRGVVKNNGNDIKVTNVLTNNCGDGFVGSFDAASDYNASDIDSDAPGAHSRNGTNGDVTFVDAANSDFALAAGDTNAIDHGTSSVDSLFTDDIEGTTRSGTWDIGADEYSEGGEEEPSATPAASYFKIMYK